VDKMKGKEVNPLENVVVRENLQELEKELSIKSKKYQDILNSMNKSRYKLRDLRKLRKDLHESMLALNQIEKFKNDREEEIKFILETNTCPKCHSVLNDSINLRSKIYNSIDDASHIRDNICKDIENILEEMSQVVSNHKECKDELILYLRKEKKLWKINTYLL